jgi:amino acid permease
VILSALIAMGVPKFGLFINLIGSVACTALAFILPIYIYNRVFANEISKLRKVVHYGLVIFGLIGGSLSFVISIYNIVLAFK